MNSPLSPPPAVEDAGPVPLTVKATLRFADCELHMPTRELWRKGARQPVRKRVFDLMAFLIERRPSAATHAEIARAVWGRQDVRSTVIAQAVLQARRATGDDLEHPAHFVSVRGVGYRFAAALKAGVGEPAQTTSSDATLSAVRADLDEARAASLRRDYDAALFLSERAISMAETAGANTLRARALSIASTAALFKGTLAVAAGYAHEALRLAQAEDNRAAAAEARVCIAQALHAGADLYGALQMLDAIRMGHDVPEVGPVALKVENLCRIIYGDLQQFDQARTWSERALRTARLLHPGRRAVTERTGAINLLLKEAEAAQDLGDLARQRSCCEQALACSQDLAADVEAVRDPVARLCWLGNMGLALTGLGRLQEAWQHAEEARRQMLSWPDRESPWYLTHLGELRLQWAGMLSKASRTAEALEEIEAGINTAAACGLHDQVLRFASLASHACEAAGQFEEALKWLRRAATAQHHQRRDRAMLLAAVYQSGRDNETLGRDLQHMRSKLVATQARVQELVEQLQRVEQRGWAGGTSLTPEDRLVSALQQRYLEATTRDLPCMVGLLNGAAPGDEHTATAPAGWFSLAADHVRNHLGTPLLPIGLWDGQSLVFPLDGMGEKRARAVCADLQRHLAELATVGAAGAGPGGCRAAPFNLAQLGSFESALATLRSLASGA